MGRMIDADELIELAKKTFYKSDGFIKLIKEQPTAYDVKRVEEQIEGMFGCEPMYYGSEARWAVDRAIEIVRKGGAE